MRLTALFRRKNMRMFTSPHLPRFLYEMISRASYGEEEAIIYFCQSIIDGLGRIRKFI